MSGIIMLRILAIVCSKECNDRTILCLTEISYAYQCYTYQAIKIGIKNTMKKHEAK